MEAATLLTIECSLLYSTLDSRSRCIINSQMFFIGQYIEQGKPQHS